MSGIELNLLPLMELIILHMIFEGILCFIDDVKCCQDNVLLFLWWSAIAIALFF